MDASLLRSETGGAQAAIGVGYWHILVDVRMWEDTDWTERVGIGQEGRGTEGNGMVQSWTEADRNGPMR